MNMSPGKTVLLKYKKPFDLSPVLSFMKPRAMAGVELVTDTQYARTFRINKTKGFFVVRDCPGQSCLELEVTCEGTGCDTEIADRVRRMFDLDRDFTKINLKFSKDAHLSKGMDAGQVPRLPVAFAPFEFVVRAILGQQISVKAATTLAGRVAGKAALTGGPGYPFGLDFFFPDPFELLALDLENLGITKTRQATLKNVAQTLVDKKLNLTANQSFETFHQAFSAVKGIGEWTSHYVAMRGLGMIDSFPATDLGVIRALTKEGKTPSRKQIVSLAEKWRPYRAYATLCLWNSKEN